MLVGISGLDKVDVLIALWKNSKMQGMSFLGHQGEMTRESAQQYINDIRVPDFLEWDSSLNDFVEREQIYFDYLNGKVMKIDIALDTIDTRSYDRDNGKGAAQSAINKLRNKLKGDNK